ncbi:MAG: rifampicin phosphotransferase [Actinomycetota bacterium]|nr:rifampicin phosphotransferase [Actinomycetota bacterium]
MTEVSILRFDHQDSGTHRLVGGKGANLGRLTRAGFPVPPGFSVTTAAYSGFIQSSGLGDKIAAIVAELKYDDPDQLEALTGEIRELIVGAALPDSLATEITGAYAELGDSYVAVRSSGTAEDLAEASFAGMHDTYLDIKGVDNLLDAVKRCWASMYTARATAYRHNKGFDHAESRIAVVVQQMVESEVSGVMFTGNPMTTATDEIVVNASWGLGEAIVSGITTPDEYLLNAHTLAVREKTLGSKTRQVVRAPGGNGTVTEDTPADKAAAFSLSDSQVAELGDLGRRVMKHYGGFPQDTEWGYAGGQFSLLQSRPVTGAEFSWDAEIDAWQTALDDDETVWTRAWADEIWTGAITPLMYSVRARCFTEANAYSQTLWGMNETAKFRMWKYHKGAAYFNCKVDKSTLTNLIWPQFRPAMAANLPPQWRDEVLSSPFRVGTWLRMQARILGMDPIHGVVKWLDVIEDYINNREEEANGLPNEELRKLSDDELKRRIEYDIAYEEKYIQDVWTGFFIQASQVVSLLGLLLAKWYDGDNPLAFTDLITGVPQRTITMEENIQLWKLSNLIRESPELRALFEANENAEFFSVLEGSEAGKAFLAKYHEFADHHPHRGHADRDIYYPRRSEDPGLDYRAFKAFLTTDASHDPEAMEREVDKRREAVVEDVETRIRKKPLGAIKVEIFKVVLDYTHRFLMDRDNERHFVDRSTFTIKRGLLEVNRRLLERGVLEDERDFYFLIKEELFDLLDGRGDLTLSQAKIAARARNFDKFHSKEQMPPLYLQRGRPVELDVVEDDTGGGLRGVGTSRGLVTGTARVVKELKDIGRVKNREILVTNSTDPGWTPVFLVISGIVLETGGMLAHGSCLAREYGFPAVQVANAMRRIPDGATITVNGDTGEVTILDEPGGAVGNGTTADGETAELTAASAG